MSRESRDGGLAWSKVLRTVSSRLLPWRRYKICMASSTETDPLSSLSFMRNSTTLNRRRGSYPARTVEKFIRNKAEGVVLRHSEVLKLRVKRTSLVISTAMIHRLELWPVHALIAIIIHLPNHVFDIRLCGKETKENSGQMWTFRLLKKQHTPFSFYGARAETRCPTLPGRFFHLCGMSQG